MKKQLVLAAGLAVLATPALASKARLQALGEDTNGSFYINDNRNIFLNASEVLNHKDMVTFEWGAGQATENVGDANAEGGFLRSSGNMVWGAQMGRVTDFSTDYQAALTQGALTNPFTPSNALDVFVGGDAGIKWGAQLTYSNRKDDAFVTADRDAEASEMDLAVGVSQGNIAGYLKYGLSGKVETDNDNVEVKRKSPLQLGASYKWMEYTFFAQYEMHNLDVDSSTTTSHDVKDTQWQIGAGRSTKLSDKATLFTKVAYVNSNQDWDDLGGAGEEDSSKQLPVTVGLEYDAASWLALRGSISQSVLINTVENDSNAAKRKQTAANTTNVNAGASFKFGDLTMDGVIGTTAGATGDNAETGTFNTDTLMSRVSMTYRF